EHSLADCDGSPVERLSLGVPALGVTDVAEIAQRFCHERIVRSKRLLLDAQAAPEIGLCFRVSSLQCLDRGEAVERLRRDCTLLHAGLLFQCQSPEAQT